MVDFDGYSTMEGKLDYLSHQVGDMAESLKVLTRTIDGVENSVDKQIKGR